THPVLIRATDPFHLWADQAFTITVTQGIPNRPPLFVSTPVVDANVDTPYTYPALATDPDGDTVIYSVVSGPPGLSIPDPSTGVVTWTPTASQLGVQHVVLQADDGHGGTAQQAFDILVQQEKN